METRKMDYCDFREWFMTEISGYVERYRSDLFLDAIEIGKIKSNKTIWFLCRKTGTNIAITKKKADFYATHNDRVFRFDIRYDKKYRTIIGVDVTELKNEQL